MHDVGVGRRRVLAYLGLSVTGAMVGGCAQPSTARVDPPAQSPEADQPIVRREYVFSEHRETTVELMIAHPGGLRTTENLPMVLYLHGKDGMRPTPIPFDTLSALERQHRRGEVTPFGFVTVDGGYNPYWNDGAAGGDLTSMLMDEVPQWLRERRLGDSDGLPFAAAGISTGGFGALHYAIERATSDVPVNAVAVLSPALLTDWPAMRERQAFTREAQWRAVDPLARAYELGPVPVGVWIGAEDAFVDGARELVNEHRNTPVFAILPGGHDSAVFDAVGSDMVRFLADHVPVSA